MSSILASSYPGPLEVVVVFDQTEPHPLSIAVPPARTVRTIVNERSPGLAGARNTGVLATTSDLVAFCDDDDAWLPDKLRLQVEALLEEPLAAVATTGISIVFRGRAHERVSRTERVTLSDLARSRGVELHPSTVLAWRTAVVGAIGLVDESIPGSYGEDYEWLLRAAQVGPIVAVRLPLVRVDWHDSSWFAGRWNTIIESIGYLLERHPVLRSEPRGLARLYGRLAFAHAAAGDRRSARHWARQALRLNWRERRGYLAFAVSSGLVSARTLVRLAHRTGRGI